MSAAPGGIRRTYTTARVDQALREAERRLETAHRLCAQPPGAQHTQAAYLEVLALRDRARRVLTELAEMWVADR